jgi:hypothetical protein
MLLGRPIRQIAYFVQDARAAAERHSRLFGSGPFFLLENIEFGSVIHRGRQVKLAHTAAFGQWGELNLEFCQQNAPGPSIFHDLFPEGSGRYGLHHAALFVDDLDEAVRLFDSHGFPEIFRATMPSIGAEASIVDTSAVYGHFTELHEPVPAMIGFFDGVRRASQGFDGSDPIRKPDFM